MNSNFNAIVLAGGKSLRIGKDKALLKVNGITLIERIYNLLRNNFNEIIIVSNSPEKYKFLTDKAYKDIYPGFGPLSGIHSGLMNSTTENNFIISCDMPFINEEVIKFILSNKSNDDIILPKSNSTIHSLCGIYKKSCLSIAEDLLKSAVDNIDKKTGKTKIKLFNLLNKTNTSFIDLTREEFFNEDLMFNMNTLDDYKYVLEKLNSPQQK